MKKIIGIVLVATFGIVVLSAMNQPEGDTKASVEVKKDCCKKGENHASADCAKKAKSHCDKKGGFAKKDCASKGSSDCAKKGKNGCDKKSECVHEKCASKASADCVKSKSVTKKEILEIQEIICIEIDEAFKFAKESPFADLSILDQHIYKD